MNSVNLIGYFTSQIPEHRYFESGKHLATFAIRVYGGKDKQGQHQSYFFDCKTWEKSAEILNDRWASKQPIGISGELTQETWQTAEGANRSRVVINVQRIDYLYATARRSAPPVSATPAPGSLMDLMSQPEPASVGTASAPQRVPVAATQTQLVTPAPSAPVAVPQTAPVAPVTPAPQPVAKATAPAPQTVTAAASPDPVAVGGSDPIVGDIPF